MDHVDFVRLLFRAMDSRVADLTSALADGAPATLERYREQVGERRGWLQVREMIRDSLDKNERQDLALRD